MHRASAATVDLAKRRHPRSPPHGQSFRSVSRSDQTPPTAESTKRESLLSRSPARPSLGPIDVLAHHRKGAIDIPPVEGRIGPSDERMTVFRTFPTVPQHWKCKNTASPAGPLSKLTTKPQYRTATPEAQPPRAAPAAKSLARLRSNKSRRSEQFRVAAEIVQLPDRRRSAQAPFHMKGVSGADGLFLPGST